MGEDLLHVLILALIEGVTEFLPVSSTGHLIVGKAALGFDRLGAVFEIVIQIGAVIAVVLYYRNSLKRQSAQLRAEGQLPRFGLAMVMACAPAAGLGLLLEAQIEAELFSPRVVALALIAGGAALLVAERWLGSRLPENAGLRFNDLSLRQALVVGAAQSLALIPGMSRSGCSIVGGLLAGMSRRAATELSFLLAIPLLGGTTVYKLLKSLPALGAEDLLLLFAGAALSGIFAWVAMDWLLGYVSRHSFVIFGVYRIVAGGLLLLALATGAIL